MNLLASLLIATVAFWASTAVILTIAERIAERLDRANTREWDRLARKDR